MTKVIIPFLIFFFFMGCKSTNLKKKKAAYELDELNKGVLFVRLPDNKKYFDELIANGKEEKALILKTKLLETQLQIMDSFKKHFNFCPVFFYYKIMSEEVEKGNFEENVFNYDGEFVGNFEGINDNYYFAYFGFPYSYKYSYQTPNHEVKVGYKEFTDSKGRIALIIMDDEGEIIPSPFPNSIMFFSQKRKGNTQAIRKLNKKLNRKYKRLKRFR